VPSPHPRPQRAFRFLLILLLAAALLPPAAARAARPTGPWQPVRHPQMATHRATGAIAIDGRLDDAGWQDLPRAEHFVEHQPGDQTQPAVPTEALLTYDDDFLYAAFICSDDPAQVRASWSERDRIWTDDYVILALDTFGNQSSAFELAANPYGVQGDLLWSAGRGEDMTYDLLFYSAGRITEDGWQVELAIPWSSLRFPDRQDQVWRVDFWRNSPRQVRYTYSWGIYERGSDCWPCQWGTVTGISGVRPGSGLTVLPAMVASRVDGREAADDGAAGEWRDGKLMGEPSLGVAYGITPSVTAEATVNPDYSQVEADAGQIDVNSAFALEYPEKRPFFQEGSDLWSTYFDAVYTRAINQPAWAAKLTGRPGGANFAALLAQDDKSPFLLPFAERSALIEGGRSWSFLTRARQNFGAQSHVGLISTARWHEGGGYGAVVGPDARVNLTDAWRLKAQLLVSTTREPGDPSLTHLIDAITFDRGRHTAAFDGEYFTGHALVGSLERSGRHLNFETNYWERSPTFRAESGFEPRNDQRLVENWTGYTFFAHDKVLDRLQPALMAGRVWDFANRPKDGWVIGEVKAWLRFAQTQVWIQAMTSAERYHEIQFDGITSREVGFQVSPSAKFSGNAEWSFGHRIARFADVMGRELRQSYGVEVRPWDRLMVEQSLNTISSDDLGTGERLFDGYLARTRLNLQMSREWSLRLVLQYDDFDRRWDADPLLTFRLNPFSIFYVGSTRSYSEFAKGIAGPDPDDEWRLAARSYFLKLQYLWQL
jgi:hypothetical protein